MKALTEKNLIALLPAYSDEVQTAATRLGDFLCAYDSVEAFTYAVTEGFVDCVSVEVNGVRSYVVFFTTDELRKLISFAAVSLVQEEHWDDLMQALETIARSKHMKWIHWTTRRAGVVKKSAAYGYRADTVNLVKELR